MKTAIRPAFAGLVALLPLILVLNDFNSPLSWGLGECTVDVPTCPDFPDGTQGGANNVWDPLYISTNTVDCDFEPWLKETPWILGVYDENCVEDSGGNTVEGAYERTTPFGGGIDPEDTFGATWVIDEVEMSWTGWLECDGPWCGGCTDCTFTSWNIIAHGDHLTGIVTNEQASRWSCEGWAPKPNTIRKRQWKVVDNNGDCELTDLTGDPGGIQQVMIISSFTDCDCTQENKADVTQWIRPRFKAEGDDDPSPFDGDGADIIRFQYADQEIWVTSEDVSGGV